MCGYGKKLDAPNSPEICIKKLFLTTDSIAVSWVVEAYCDDEVLVMVLYMTWMRNIKRSQVTNSGRHPEYQPSIPGLRKENGQGPSRPEGHGRNVGRKVYQDVIGAWRLSSVAAEH